MSIFGPQPDTLTLEDYTVILPIGTPQNGDVMQIDDIDPTNHIITLEWSEKSINTETVFENAKVKIRLDMGNPSTTPTPTTGSVINMEDNNANALYIGEGTNKYIRFDTTNGSMEFEKTSKFNKNLTIAGNLIVNGTTTTVNSTVVTIKDPILTLGEGTNNVNDSKDRGIEFKYNDGSPRIGFFGYDESDSVFTFFKDATNNSEVFSGVLGNVKFGSGSTIGNLTLADGSITDSSGAISFDNENLSTTGTVSCGAITSTGNLDVTGTITGDTSLTLDSTTITTAEIGVLDGVTPGTATASKALVVDANKDIATIRNLTIDGEFTDGNYTFDTNGNVSGLGTVGCGAITSTGNLDVTGTITGDTSLTLDSTTITTAEIGVLDGVTPGTATASKALVVDANKDIATIRNLTIDGEFTDGNYTFDTNGNVSGLGTVGCGAITSSGNLEVTGTITGDTSLTLDSTTITTAEIGVLDGVTPGTATASKALVVDANKDIATIRNLTIDGEFTNTHLIQTVMSLV